MKQSHISTSMPLKNDIKQRPSHRRLYLSFHIYNMFKRVKIHTILFKNITCKWQNHKEKQGNDLHRIQATFSLGGKILDYGDALFLGQGRGI